MKIVSMLVLVGLTILMGCESDETCNQPPCARPNINNLVVLTLNFQSAQVGEQVGLVRLDKINKSIIDTIQFELPANKLITIGSGGVVGFTEPVLGEVFESATLDFIVLHSNEAVNDISAIEIQGTSPVCGCAVYQISSLIIDGEILAINSDSYTLNL